jgi:endonuclease III
LSQLTSNLLGQRQVRPEAKWPHVLALVADRLVATYGTPTLGNFRDPVKEIFYILLSARTNERLYKPAHRRLSQRFPEIEQLANARIHRVLECVRGAGLGVKRAKQVVGIANRLLVDLGRNPQRQLRRMTAAEAYRYLTHLPGVGPKSAFCVMLCSLDHDVFPVDVNVQRVLERLGTLRKGLKHYQAQMIAPKFVPPGRSKELHVGLVEHGRRICVPRRPKCHTCILVDLCRHGRIVEKKHLSA